MDEFGFHFGHSSSYFSYFPLPSLPHVFGRPSPQSSTFIELSLFNYSSISICFSPTFQPPVFYLPLPLFISTYTSSTTLTASVYRETQTTALNQPNGLSLRIYYTRYCTITLSVLHRLYFYENNVDVIRPCLLVIFLFYNISTHFTCSVLCYTKKYVKQIKITEKFVKYPRRIILLRTIFLCGLFSKRANVYPRYVLRIINFKQIIISGIILFVFIEHKSTLLPGPINILILIVINRFSLYSGGKIRWSRTHQCRKNVFKSRVYLNF